MNLFYVPEKSPDFGNSGVSDLGTSDPGISDKRVKSVIGTVRGHVV